MRTDPPRYPAGHLPPDLPESFALADLEARIVELERAPGELRASVRGQSEAQLDTAYRNWTIRQIVHHLPDSHVNGYVRFMLALTEDTPTIRPYDETAWSALGRSRTGDIAIPLALMDSIHASWVGLMRQMSVADFARPYHHPELKRDVRLADAVAQYAWHGRHHTAQILWRREAEGWN
jgi:hypothetical protein